VGQPDGERDVTTYQPEGTTPAGEHAAPGPAEDGRSLGQIVGDVANDLTTLVKQEIELAKTEAKAEAAKAGKGVGLFGGAGAAGYLTLIFLSLALMFLLDSWMDIGWAALIVGVLWGIAAAVMAMTGRKELKAMNPQLEKTQRTIKEDVAWAKQQKSK
jgi:F0F1-type ATP synthase assembly protein I